MVQSVIIYCAIVVCVCESVTSRHRHPCPRSCVGDPRGLVVNFQHVSIRDATYDYITVLSALKSLPLLLDGLIYVGRPPKQTSMSEVQHFCMVYDIINKTSADDAVVDIIYEVFSIQDCVMKYMCIFE